MRQYLDTLRHVRDNGVKKGDRTGTGTTEVFGVQTRYNLADGFPALPKIGRASCRERV
mgnify:CR=1 FL=1